MLFLVEIRRENIVGIILDNLKQIDFNKLLSKIISNPDICKINGNKIEISIES